MAGRRDKKTVIAASIQSDNRGGGIATHPACFNPFSTPGSWEIPARRLVEHDHELWHSLPADEFFTAFRHTNLFTTAIAAQLPLGQREGPLRITFPATWLVEIITGSIVWSAGFLCSSSATATPACDDVDAGMNREHLRRFCS